MPGKALRWVHPKITSPWPQPGGPLLLGMPPPWGFTLHQKNTLWTRGVPPNKYKEWVSPRSWRHHRQYENRVAQCASLPKFHAWIMLSGILYPNWIVHVTRNNHIIVRDENEGRRISQHYERWKWRQTAILLQFRNQGLLNDMKSLPKILLKFLFLFYWIFNDNFFLIFNHFWI